MKKLTFSSLIILFSWCLFTTGIALSDLITPPLSAEEAEVVKPLQRIVEAGQKKDVELWMSAYHDKATIEVTSGGKMSKEKLRKYFKFDEKAGSGSYDVQKIEIKGDKATVELICKEGSGRVISMKFYLVKEKGSWLIMERRLR